MKAFDYFDRKVCLTLDGSPMYDRLTKEEKQQSDARWHHAKKEFERVGLRDVIKFSALPDIGGHQSFNRSIRQILIDFRESDATTLLLLEDDCVFKDLSHFDQALKELPANWDILYLGANIRDKEPKKLSTHVYKLNDAWTTHAIAYQKTVVDFLLLHQPGFSEQMFDNWQGGAALPRFNCFVINPMLAWQKPGHSFIWNGYTDYTEQFVESQKLMAV